jgi:hypothetical protein
MHKLQLELIPYPSREFKGVLDSSKLAEKNIDALLPFVTRLLDAIVQYDRKYVIFGARQFNTLFQAYSAKGCSNISFSEETSTQIEGLEKRVFCRTMEVEHKGKAFKAIIPYSFPRQDLPNAHEKMRQYGKFCYETYLKA